MADDVVVEDEVVTEGGEKPDRTVVSDEVAQLLKERDRREAEMRKKSEKAEKRYKDELEALKKQVEELTNPRKGKEGDDAETLEVKLMLVEQRAKQREEELEAQIAKERQAREAAEAKERENERLRLLSEALDSIGVANKELAKRYFDRSVIFDEVDDRWAYRTQDGKVVALREGIEVELPPELKPSTLRSGAGVSGSTAAGKTRNQKELEQIEARLSNLSKEIKQRGALPRLLAQYDSALQERNRLRKELSKVTK